eukprot:g1721.t1
MKSAIKRDGWINIRTKVNTENKYDHARRLKLKRNTTHLYFAQVSIRSERDRIGSQYSLRLNVDPSNSLHGR